MAYTGNSIVDYLKSQGQDSSYSNRGQIYSKSGLNLGNYSGTAQQNTALLNYLRGGGQSSSSPAPASTPAPVPQTPAAVTPQSSSSSGNPRYDAVQAVNQNLIDNQNKLLAQQQNAQQKVVDFYGSLEDPNARLDRFNSQYGVTDQQALVNALRKDVMNAQTSVDNIEPSVNARTGDFLVNEADRNAIIAREQAPLLKELNKLLENKSREEIGLSDAKNMVVQAIQAATQADQNRLQPLLLGVDYSKEDYNTAMGLLKEVSQNSLNAYFQDIASNEAQAADTRNFNQQVALQKMKDSSSNTKTQADQTKQKTEDAWNYIVGLGSTEYDVWKYINENQDQLRSQGVDVNDLWSRHLALKAKTGQGGAYRSSANSSQDAFLQALNNL